MKEKTTLFSIYVLVCICVFNLIFTPPGIKKTKWRKFKNNNLNKCWKSKNQNNPGYHWPTVTANSPLLQLNYERSMNNFLYDPLINSQSLICYCRHQHFSLTYAVTLHQLVDHPFANLSLMVHHLLQPNMLAMLYRQHLVVISLTGKSLFLVEL